ncbi:TIM44-like domain-containing protein [Phyllobacterium myrsinacearum]|uniref:Putative lipid-binding transport protein (Tim44 family) n=1 Tax=Phyllobacterium myrsinacearum TaxID=28101 RepID=A0A839EQR5_9HYPH|nr:Tim44 domain-containing protein [Phyllobacterium myrsinacearum]MBA8881259.1 putative lipid-binding transport protein (Tim44 family) [Phyllobacterium myrsinacearum]
MSGTASRIIRIVVLLVLALAVTLSAFDIADARRAGGGFGSRGTRTFDAPATTRTAPSPAAPIERTMTPRTQTNQPSAMQPQMNTQRPGFFSGFGRSMIGGLLVGGLIGTLLGHGFGGGFGFLGMLLQIGLVIGAVMLAMRFFAQRRQSPATASGPAFNQAFGRAADPSASPSFRIPSIGSAMGTGSSGSGSAAPRAAPVQSSQSSDELGLSQQDLDRFEQLLTGVQTAYGTENYAVLRTLTTPEAMSYLAEELGENATNGVRNSVSDVKLLQGDIAESWREENAEYATLAMRYSSIDAMLDRTTGKLVDGDNTKATETTEVWTFVRKNGEEWKLSAIQSA